jgi:hypothetical protein
MALRSMFGGILPADLIETYGTPQGQQMLRGAIHSGHGGSVPDFRKLLQQLQARNAPGAIAQRGAAGIEGWLMGGLNDILQFVSGNPSLAGAAAIVGAPAIRAGVTRGIPALGRAVLGGAADAAGIGSGDVFGALLGTALGVGVGGLATYAGFMVDPATANPEPLTGRRRQQMNRYVTAMNTAAIVAMARRKYHGRLTPQAISWMLNAAAGDVPAAEERHLFAETFPHGLRGAHGSRMDTPGWMMYADSPYYSQPRLGEQMMQQVLRQLTLSGASGVDPNTAFQKAVDQFAKSVDKISGVHQDIRTQAAVFPQGGMPQAPGGGAVLTAATFNPGLQWASLLAFNAMGSGGGSPMLASAYFPSAGGPGGTGGNPMAGAGGSSELRCAAP